MRQKKCFAANDIKQNYRNYQDVIITKSMYKTNTLCVIAVLKK